MPALLQQAAADKPSCNWRAAKNDLNTKAAYTVTGNTEYFAPTNMQLVR